MRTNQQFDLVTLGILVFDLFGKPIEEFPEKGTSLYFDTLQMHPGGCAYNTGVVAARLGLDVAIVGKLGEDAFGDTIASHLESEGISLNGISRTESESTSSSFIMVPEDGQRRIYTYYGANSSLCLEDIDFDLLSQSRIVHIAGASMLPKLDGGPMKALLQKAQEAGVTTSMDPVIKPDMRDSIVQCLPYLDIFLPNSEESFYITGYEDPEKQIRFYIDSGVKTAGIKMGHKGSLISDGDKLYRIGVYDVPVVDTCGAGDAFVAGFLYGTLQGWDTLKTAHFATATSGKSIGAIGTTTAAPNAHSVFAFMKDNHFKIPF